MIAAWSLSQELSNQKARKKLANQKWMHKLRDIRTSFREPLRRRTIPAVYCLRRRLSHTVLTSFPSSEPLGSIPSLPAQSCKDIKANEGEQAVSGNSWLDVTGSGEVILAYCDMNTEGLITRHFIFILLTSLVCLCLCLTSLAEWCLTEFLRSHLFLFIAIWRQLNKLE